MLVYDKSINAFVAGGQIVYIHSGLIDAADNANEVQGVIAHELGHVTGGHAVFQRDGGAGGISLLSLALGLAAIAAGAPEAGTGIMMAGQRAALGQYLAFSRGQEASADARGGALPQHRRGQRQGDARILQEAPEPRISLRLLFVGSGKATPSTARTRCRGIASRR